MLLMELQSLNIIIFLTQAQTANKTFMSFGLNKMIFSS